MITITIPTTGRPQRLNKCVKSINYYGKVQVNIGCRSIHDDVPEFFKTKEGFRISFDFIESDKHIVPLQNELGAMAPEHSHVLPASDDIEFEKDALIIAAERLQKKFPDYDGIIGLHISNMDSANGSPYGFMLVGSKFFNKRLKRQLFFPKYRHFYADTELGEYARALGRFQECPEARVIHHHPCTGVRPDATHLNGRQAKWTHDNKLFRDRSKQMNMKNWEEE